MQRRSTNTSYGQLGYMYISHYIQSEMMPSAKCQTGVNEWIVDRRMGESLTSDLWEKTDLDMLRTERCFKDPLRRDAHT